MQENGQLLRAISVLQGMRKVYLKRVIAMISLRRFFAFSDQQGTLPVGVEHAQWTVDKRPANYAPLGWINAAMPEARIILQLRDVRDVALAMFKNDFDDPGQNFSFEEQRIKHRLQLFEETVTDWRALGAEMLEVHYEDLVRTPEATLQTITDYCNVPFDPAMLNPRENTGSIRTVSSTQARQGVNTGSVARWERYRGLFAGGF